jgi:hypothetical protein
VIDHSLGSRAERRPSSPHGPFVTTFDVPFHSGSQGVKLGSPVGLLCVAAVLANGGVRL